MLEESSSLVFKKTNMAKQRVEGLNEGGREGYLIWLGKKNERGGGV